MLPYRTFTEINLGIFNIQVWGLMAAIGVLLATMLAVKRAKVKHIKEEVIYDLTFYLLLFGIIGSRLLYVIDNWYLYSNNLFEIIKFWEGGLAFTGGFLLATMTAYVYLKIKKLNFLVIADVFTPAIVLGHIFGRIGCYLIGDHLGTPSNSPWAIMQEGVLRHPVILYEIIYLSIIFLLLLKLSKFKLVKGTTFVSYLTMYSVARFVNDFYRIDPLYYGLTVAQYLMITIFVSSMIWYLVKKKL